MKTFLRRKPITFLLGAAFALTTTLAYADDEIPVRRHRHTAKAEHVEKKNTAPVEVPSSRAKSSGRLPTRDGRHSQVTEGRAVGGANGPEYGVVTGSNIPKRYNRRGYTTDSDQNVQIIDQNDQRFRSRNSVGEILRSDPSIRVNGPRGM